MRHLTSLVLIALLSMATVNLQAQETKHQHPEHLSVFINHYLNMKNALTENDFKEAKSYLQKLKKEGLKSSEMKNHPKHIKMHKKHHTAMMKAINAASKAENLSEFRLAFADISDHLIKAVKNQSYEQQKLYIQFCFMGRGNEGAYWLSEQKKIDNPYLEKMSSCGKTVEEIEG